MNDTLNQLQAKRAELLVELARVEEVIKNFADSSPVQIETSKNLRNSQGVTWLPEESDRWMMVYADEALTVPADKSSHNCWVSKAALAAYKLQYPNWKEIFRVVE